MEKSVFTNWNNEGSHGIMKWMVRVEPIVFVITIFTIVFGIVGNSQAETFQVGLFESGFMPMYSGKKEVEAGIFEDVLQEITKITKDQFVKKYYPAARVYDNFKHGTIDVDLVACSEWFPGEDDFSVYTRPFIKFSEAVYVRKGTMFPVKTLEDLRGKTVGVIREYTYPDWTAEDVYIPDFAKDEQQLFRKFKGGRYDILYTGVPLAQYYSQKYDLNIEVAHIMYTVNLGMRFHVKKASAVMRINQALEQLIQEKKIDEITKKYTGNTNIVIK